MVKSIIIDRLQPCVDVTPAIMRCLEKLSKTKYPELYEKGDGQLEDDVRSTLFALASEDKHPDKSCLIWVGWSLCLASIPTIEWVLKEDPRPSSVRVIFTKWKNKRLKDGELWRDVTFADLGRVGPQNLSEALLVLECQKNMYFQHSETELIDAVAESIDLCLQGYAVAAGAADRRPILNWIVNYVIPSAHHNRTPDEIYSIDTML